MSAQTTADQSCVTRVEVVDNWHARWPDVLAEIEQQAQRDLLHMDGDGWLSARQVLLAAFCGERVAGHLAFNLQPFVDERRNVVVNAQLDACGVAPGFARVEVESLLRSAAVGRANQLHIAKRIGF